MLRHGVRGISRCSKYVSSLQRWGQRSLYVMNKSTSSTILGQRIIQSSIMLNIQDNNSNLLFYTLDDSDDT